MRTLSGGARLVRNRTTNQYAALDVGLREVLAEMTQRHRAEEFRRFLDLIDSSVPARLDMHPGAQSLLHTQDPLDPRPSTTSRVVGVVVTPSADVWSRPCKVAVALAVALSATVNVAGVPDGRVAGSPPRRAAHSSRGRLACY